MRDKAGEGFLELCSHGKYLHSNCLDCKLDEILRVKDARIKELENEVRAYELGIYGVDASKKIGELEAEVAYEKERNKLNTLSHSEEVKDSINYIKDFVTDYPYEQNTLNEAVHAIVLSLKGSDMACDDLRAKLKAERELTDRLKEALDCYSFKVCKDKVQYFEIDVSRDCGKCLGCKAKEALRLYEERRG